MDILQKYMSTLSMLDSEDRKMKPSEIRRASYFKKGNKKKMTRDFLDVAVSRGEILEKILGKQSGYVISENGARNLKIYQEYEEFSKSIGLKCKNGVGLKICATIIETLKKFPGLNYYKIFGKTYKVSSSDDHAKKCLDFLEQGGYISSKEPNGESYGPTKKIYFPEEKGIQFVAGLHRFNSELDINGLEERLQNLV